MEERRMSKGNYRTSTVNERWREGVSIHLSHGPMGIRLILIFYYFNVILLKSSRAPAPAPPSPPLILNKALNNERSFIL